MYKVKTHAAANAKAKVILGSLLTEADFTKLIQLETADAVKSYLLTKTHYQKMAMTITDDTEAFEILLKKYFFTVYEKFFLFYVDEYRNFFKAMLNRYEVENLKLFIRTLNRGESVSGISEHLLYSTRYSNLDYRALLTACTMEDLMIILKGTLYFDTLKIFIDEPPEQMSFHMEMALDRSYFNRLYDAIMKLKKRDREIMLNLYGINVDILNIQWIYRGRKYFDISSEELFNFTLSEGKNYDFKALKTFCYMDLEAYKSVVESGDYGAVFKDKPYMMERAMEKHLFYRMDDFTKHAENSIAWPMVLIHKFEYEVRDLYTILEAKKYGVADTQSFLIRELKGAM